MRKRNRINNIADLNRLPVTPRSTTGGESVLTAGVLPTSRNGLKEFTAAYDAEEKAKQEAPLNKLLSEFNQTLRELRKVQAENVFTHPSEELAGRCTQRPDFVEGTAAQIADQVLAAARASGINPNQSGRDKIVAVLKVNPMIDTRKPENWKALYDYLIELRVLTVEDGVPEPASPKPQAAPQPEPSIEHIPADTREGRIECLRIVGGQWGQQVRDFYAQWATSMWENWGVDVLTEEMAKRVGEFFKLWNLNPLAAKSYDAFRLYANRNHLLPGDRDYRTNTEILTEMIENSDLSSREVKIEIARRTRENSEV